MALSAPVKLVATSGTHLSSSTFTVSGVNPTPNALLLVFVVAVNSLNPATMESINCAAGSLSGVGGFTRIDEFNHNAGTDTHVAAFWSQVGATPASGTIILSTANGTNVTGWGVDVVEVTGHLTPNPIVQSVTASGFATSISATLPSSPAASSLVMAVLNSRGEGSATEPGTTPEAGYTELTDERAGISAAWLAVQYKLGNAGTTVGWTDANSGLRNLVVAFEVAEGSSGTDDLVADNVETGSPTLGTPTLGQVHALGAGMSIGLPTLDAPVLGQVHGLTPTGVATGSPTLDTPVVGQVHPFTPTELITGSPDVGEPTFGQIHALTTNGITTGAPVVPVVSAEIPLSLVANDITTGVPTLGSPDMEQTGLIAVSIDTGEPEIGTPALGQVHSLVPVNITTGAVSIDVVQMTYYPYARGILTGNPDVGDATLAQIHALTALAVTLANPELGTPLLGMVYGMVANELATDAPTLATPALGQVHALTADELATEPPYLDVPILSFAGIDSLEALSIFTEAPVLGEPDMVLGVEPVFDSPLPRERTLVVKGENRILVVY